MTITFALILTICATLGAFWLFLRDPSNIGSIVSVLTVIFGLYTAVTFVYFGVNTFYSFRSVLEAGDFLFNMFRMIPAMFYLAAITFAFVFGAIIAQVRLGSSAQARMTVEEPHLSQLTIAIAIGLAVWAVLLGAEILSSGVDLKYAFAPAVRTGRYENTSGYIYAMMMSLPLVLMIMYSWRKTRSNLVLMVFTVLAILTCLTTHQRREIVTALLAVAGVFAVMPKGSTAIGAIHRRQRRIVIVGLLIGLLAVPGFWYARIYATNLERGLKVNPFEIRSVSELLMGSPATQFPIFVVIRDRVAASGIHPLFLPAQIVSTPIPRSMWPNKPTDLDTILQTQYQLSENPSVFWTGDLYYGFGVFSVFVAALLGYLFTYVHGRATLSPKPFFRSQSILLLMMSVTLFKNGLYQFTVRYVVALLLLTMLAWIAGLWRERSLSPREMRERSALIKERTLQRNRDRRTTNDPAP